MTFTFQMGLLQEQEAVIQMELSKFEVKKSPQKKSKSKNKELEQNVMTNDLVKMVEGDTSNPFLPDQEIFNKFSFVVCASSANFILSLL